MSPDRQALARLLGLLLAIAIGTALAISGCTVVPPMPPPQPPEPPPAAPCERSCVRYIALGCTPVLELPECSKTCEQMEAFAAEAGAGIGWNPVQQAEATTCEQWLELRGDGA